MTSRNQQPEVSRKHTEKPDQLTTQLKASRPNKSRNMNVTKNKCTFITLVFKRGKLSLHFDMGLQQIQLDGQFTLKWCILPSDSGLAIFLESFVIYTF